ncbi:MAG: hypothetical protein AAF959_22865 [Cyanobacteria bacterium P01_D01_bin.56]
MSQLSITDIDFFEDISCQDQVIGGYRRTRVDVAADVAADVDADVDASFSVEGRLRDGYLSIFSRGSTAAAAAVAVASGDGRASARAVARA